VLVSPPVSLSNAFCFAEVSGIRRCLALDFDFGGPPHRGGLDSFRRGHIIESLTQDVRALELFAGRTEALREAVASETLP